MDKDNNQMDQGMNENTDHTENMNNAGNAEFDSMNQGKQAFGQSGGFDYQQPNYGFYNEQSYGPDFQSQGNNYNQENNYYQDNAYNQGNNFNQYNNPYQGNFDGNYNGNGMDSSQEPKKPKKNKKANKVLKLCGVVALGLVVGVGAFATLRAVERIGSTKTEEGSKAENNSEAKGEEDQGEYSSNVEIGSTDTVTEAKDNGVSKVVESALPSIVMINCNVNTTQYGQTTQGVASGSGIIIKEDKSNLYIVTNYHVVSGAESVSVVFADEESVDATLKAYDSTNDLAILKISLSKIKDSTKKAIKLATIGSSDNLKVGSMAIAIGNALGYGQSVTVGYVSALDRAVTIDNTTRVLLQTDAAINPGNSGGALLDINGKLIGINSAKYSSTDVEGVCYAIPISKAIPIINDLMTKETLKEEEKGYLGITGSDVDETAHAYYNVPLGVRVASVESGGAADKGGIKEKDIITAVNGIQVTSISALKERVNGYKYGTEVTLTVQRQSDGSYKEMKIKVTLQKGTTTNNQSSEQSQSNGSSNGNGSDGGNYYYYYGGQDGSNGFPFSIN